MRVRKATSTSERRSSTSDRRYSETRSSELASNESGLRMDFRASSAARAKRAGHPSVRCRKVFVVSIDSRRPSSRPNPAASRSSIASSSRPISTREPSALQRANGRRVRVRAAIATCEPSVKFVISSARTSRHAREVIRCASSMAIPMGSEGRDIAASNRPTTVRFESEADAIPLKSSGPTGSRRSIAVARSVRNTTGSLSLSSAVSHATGPGFSVAHWTRRLVLP